MKPYCTLGWFIYACLLLPFTWQTAISQCTSNSDIGGKIYGDFNYNSEDDQVFQGIGNVRVTLYGVNTNGDRVTIGEQTTTLTGEYVFPDVSFTGPTSKYLLVFSLPVGLFATTEGGINNTTVRWIESNGCDFDLAASEPQFYCHTDDPTYVTARSVNGNTNLSGSAASTEVIVSTRFKNKGYPGQPGFTEDNIDALGSDVGSILGIAYHRYDESAFFSAYAKRHVSFGPSGIGAIYRQSFPNGLSQGAPEVYVDLVNDFGIDVGEITSRDLPAQRQNPSRDSDAYAKIGKVGIGDIDISDNNELLYAINMFEKTLVVVEIGNPLSNSPRLVDEVAIPNPCAIPNDWRPMALKYYRGDLYVGGICSGQTNAAVPIAYVYKYNSTTGFSTTPVLEATLDYFRDDVISVGPPWSTSAECQRWNSWSDNPNLYGPTGSGTDICYPQPMFSDIEFDVDASMVIGFRDRFGDQWGWYNYHPDVTVGGTFRAFAGGDFLRADPNPNGGGTYILENNGVSQGKVGCGQNNNQGPGGGEFYCGDELIAPPTYPSGSSHQETSTGMLALFGGEGAMLTTVYDPNRSVSQGTKLLSTINGTSISNYEIYQYPQADPSLFGKANGLGDIEIFCEPAPIEIGNLVWNDKNYNGIQDPNEEGLSSIRVCLTDANGTTLQETTTDARGHYYFRDLEYETKYYVVLKDYDKVNGLTNGGFVYLLATKDQGVNDHIDSDASIGDNIHPSLIRDKAIICTTTGQAGETDHSLDFGLNLALSSIGNRVWLDDNANGIQDPGELGVDGVRVELKNDQDQVVSFQNTTGGGYYLFEDLLPGTYKICFIPQTGYEITTPNATANEELDSDADPLTGMSHEIILAPNVDDLSVDAGIYRFASLGDFVWLDVNKNGIQDSGEKGLDNKLVTLFKMDGTQVDQMRTTADGMYFFRDLVPGRYYVRFDLMPGLDFSNADSGGNDARDSDVDDSNGTGTTKIYILSSGEVDLDIDAGMVCTVTVSAGMDQEICKGQESAVLLAVASNGSGTYTYSWDQGLGSGATHVVSPDVTTTYSVTVTDVNGCCVVEDQVMVVVNPVPSVEAVKDTTICEGFGTFIEAIARGGDGTYSYNWDQGLDGSREHFVSPPSINNVPTDWTYTVEVTDGNGCTAMDNVTVTVNPRGCIGDKVWSDLDGDGEQDANEPGIDGVIVHLMNADCDILFSDETKDGGEYSFCDLCPGEYIVQFVKPASFERFTAQDAADDTIDSDADRVTGKTEIVNLRPGENFVDLDAGLYSSGKLGDHVWEDLNGNGIQDANEPGVNGVVARLYKADGTFIAEEITGVSPLDGSNGFYAFLSLIPMDYYVEFVIPNGYSATAPNNGSEINDSDVDGSNGPNTTRTYTVGEGEFIRVVDLGIYKGAGLGDYVWEDANRNGLQDTGERGINGVKVLLYEDDNMDGNPDGAAIAERITNTFGGRDGYYVFNTLDPGKYVLEFESPSGYSSTIQLNMNSKDQNDSDVSPISGFTGTITLVAGEFDDSNDAGFFASGCLGDYVWEDRNFNGIQDFNESGVNNVLVTLFDASTGNEVGSMFTTRNPIDNRSGYYKFDNLTPGEYYIKVGPNSLPGGFELTKSNLGNEDEDSDIDGSNGPNTSGNFTVAAGGQELRLDVGIWLPAQIGNFVWEDLNLDGVQNDGSISGLNGVEVLLIDAVTSMVVERTTTMNDPRSGSKGFYCFERIVPGSYYLEFNLPVDSDLLLTDQNVGNDDLDSDISGDFGPGTTSQINVFAGQINKSIDVGYFKPAKIGDYVWEDIGPGNSLDGIQNDNESGLPGATVTLYDALTMSPVIGLAPVVTGADGAYLFCVRPGQYYLQFDPPSGYIVSPEDVGGNDFRDSDVTHTFGPNTTRGLTVGYGETNLSIDAGFFNRALSVDLLGFNVEKLGHDVRTFWTVDNENTAKEYVLERRHQSDISYSEIATIEAKNLNSLFTYEYLDQAIDQDGTYLYRLLLTELDGSQSYFGPLSIELDGKSVNTDWDLFPNPANISFDIRFEKGASNVEGVEVLSVEGIQWAYVEKRDRTSKSLTFDVSTWPSGVYFVFIHSKNGRSHKTIVIE